jgi:diguanylate cyclase (GGDEF)-like protein
MDEINTFFGNSPLLSKIYDISRVVDPVGKRVMRYADNKTVYEDFKCFDFWGNNKMCDNCISIRAYNENLTYIKMEFNKEKVFLITAVPYELGDRRVVIELLKEITDNMQFGKDEHSSADMKEIHVLIDNMNKLASFDHLTGLYNRRFINEKLPVEVMSAVVSQKPFTLIMTDIDHFKDINDSMGHIVGDIALKEFADILQAAADNGKGWAARFGGDEFLICLPETGYEKALEIAQQLRRTVENKKIVAEGHEFSMTASFGLYTADTKLNGNIENVLKRVDEKLYDAKSKGRNRVE